MYVLGEGTPVCVCTLAGVGMVVDLWCMDGWEGVVRWVAGSAGVAPVPLFHGFQCVATFMAIAWATKQMLRRDLLSLWGQQPLCVSTCVFQSVCFLTHTYEHA